MNFSPVFLALGILHLLPPWIIMLPKKLIRWEAAGNALGQGLCRSWGESGEDVAGEGDPCQAAGGGSLWRGRGAWAGWKFKAECGGSGEAKFLRAPLFLVPGGEEG